MKNRVIGLVIMLMVSLNALGQTATINLDQSRQEIRGFGGINHPVWYSDLNDSERDLCFGNEDGQMGLTILRVWVSPDRNQWPLGVETAQRAVEHGAIVFASPWNPPASMTYTDNEGQERIRTEAFGDYAQHLNDYVTFMRDNGVELYAISTQNEPDYAHDWTEWTPQESVDFIKGYADQIDCRLMTPESFQYRKDVYDPILNAPAALANVDIFGTHLYGTQYRDFPYPLFEQKGGGKELWMTEVYTDSQHDGNLWSNDIINEDQHALKVAEHIHYAMTEGQFQTYVFWPLRRYYALIHDGATDSQGNQPAAAGTVTKRGYCMAQFSKWIRPGFVRVDATKSPANNVFVSAYTNDDGQVVIVAVNKNTSSRTLTLDIPGMPTTSWEQYTTSANKSLAQGTDINAGSSFQVTLDAASVTTFVGEGSSDFPEVNIIEPANDLNLVEPASVNIEATATDANGTISNVSFYNGNTLLGSDNSTPYTYNWSNVTAGTYEIRAVATDNEGNTAEDEVMIRVNVPQSPYNGTLHPIPGTIQLEEYDVGGNGFAYHDDTPGSETGVDFRTDEDVDIEESTDTGGGYNLGWTASGEWVEYSVDVDATGTYDLDIRVACDADDRTLSVEMDGAVIAGDVAIPNTGGWQEWNTITINDVELTAGEQIMRVAIGEEDYINLNYVTFTAVDIPISPEISITAPSSGNTFTILETVTIEADATDEDGTVTGVEFYAGETLTGTDNTSPYSLDWSGMEPGIYELTAIATDDGGNTTISEPVTVTIEGVQSPFNGTAHLIPGRIEAEEYDLGGEGLGYHEANINGNEGGSTFRDDEVDIEATEDTDGDYNLGYILNGEWLAYTVEVTSTGTYDLDLRVATDGDGKVFHIEIDGEDITGPIDVPNTGGFQVWQTVTMNDLDLTEGEHEMRIVFDTDYMNLNYVEFKGIVTSVKPSGTNQNISVYPNPFSIGIKIDLNERSEYIIYDATGNIVEEGLAEAGQLVGKTLSSGMYVIIVKSSSEVRRIKITKQE